LTLIDVLTNLLSYSHSV